VELIITGKNMEISNGIREYVERKAGKLDRYLRNMDEAHLELTRSSAKSAGDRHIAQLTGAREGNYLAS
jgi:ribosomal subunit interface protein